MVQSGKELQAIKIVNIKKKRNENKISYSVPSAL